MQVQELGLQSEYLEDPATNSLLKRFMALPYLSADKIPRIFQKLQRKTDTDSLQEFAAYVEDTWITSTSAPPPPLGVSIWSQYARIMT